MLPLYLVCTAAVTFILNALNSLSTDSIIQLLWNSNQPSLGFSNVLSTLSSYLWKTLPPAPLADVLDSTVILDITGDARKPFPTHAFCRFIEKCNNNTDSSCHLATGAQVEAICPSLTFNLTAPSSSHPPALLDEPLSFEFIFVSCLFGGVVFLCILGIWLGNTGRPGYELSELHFTETSVSAQSQLTDDAELETLTVSPFVGEQVSIQLDFDLKTGAPTPITDKECFSPLPAIESSGLPVDHHLAGEPIMTEEWHDASDVEFHGPSYDENEFSIRQFTPENATHVIVDDNDDPFDVSGDACGVLELRIGVADTSDDDMVSDVLPDDSVYSIHGDDHSDEGYDNQEHNRELSRLEVPVAYADSPFADYDNSAVEETPSPVYIEEETPESESSDFGHHDGPLARRRRSHGSKHARERKQRWELRKATLATSAPEDSEISTQPAPVPLSPPVTAFAPPSRPMLLPGPRRSSLNPNACEFTPGKLYVQTIVESLTGELTETEASQSIRQNTGADTASASSSTQAQTNGLQQQTEGQPLARKRRGVARLIRPRAGKKVRERKEAARARDAAREAEAAIPITLQA